MDIRIGITNSPRELSFETDKAADEIRKTVAEALSTSAPFFELSDTKGAVYLVPTAGVAYVELGTEESRRIGFVA